MILEQVLTGRATHRSHVEFYMTEPASLNSFFSVCVWAPRKRLACLHVEQFPTAFGPCLGERKKSALLALTFCW